MGEPAYALGDILSIWLVIPVHTSLRKWTVSLFVFGAENTKRSQLLASNHVFSSSMITIDRIPAAFLSRNPAIS